MYPSTQLRDGGIIYAGAQTDCDIDDRDCNVSRSHGVLTVRIECSKI